LGWQLSTPSRQLTSSAATCSRRGEWAQLGVGRVQKHLAFDATLGVLATDDLDRERVVNVAHPH
jgi:hypothetical protein